MDIKDTNVNTRKMALIAVLLIVVVSIISVSFAYFTIKITTKGDISPIRGKTNQNIPNISFTENKSGTILTNTYPMKNEDGLANSDEYIFTVTNNETSDINISVILQTTKSSTLDDSLVNIAIENQIKTLGRVEDDTKEIDSEFKNGYLIDTFSLGAGESATRHVKMWMNENGTLENAQNKTWASKIKVSPTFK